MADAPRRIWRKRCRRTTCLARVLGYMRCTRCREANAELLHHVCGFCGKMSGETREMTCCIEFEVEYISWDVKGAHAGKDSSCRGGCGLEWRLLSAEKWQRGLRTTKKRRKRCKSGEAGKNHSRRRPWTERVRSVLGFVAFVLWTLSVFSCCLLPLSFIYERKMEGI